MRNEYLLFNFVHHIPTFRLRLLPSFRIKCSLIYFWVAGSPEACIKTRGRRALFLTKSYLACLMRFASNLICASWISSWYCAKALSAKCCIATGRLIQDPGASAVGSSICHKCKVRPGEASRTASAIVGLGAATLMKHNYSKTNQIEAICFRYLLFKYLLSPTQFNTITNTITI